MTATTPTRLSSVSSIASLVISLVALLLAWRAWTNPFPSDPTRAPKFDVSDIETAQGAKALLDFTEENAGRKVRLQTRIDRDWNLLSEVNESGFTIPAAPESGGPCAEPRSTGRVS